MPRILNKPTAFACLALFAAGIFFCFTSNHSRAAVDSDDVQMVVTTYRDGKVYETTSTVERAQFSAASSEEAVPPGNHPAAAGDIVLSQIYSNGGNAGSTYQNNYLELFNRTDNPIDFDGWRIYFTSANGSFDQAISFTSSRQIFIGGHQYLLIRFGPDSSNGAPLSPDLIVPPDNPTIPGLPPLPPPQISPSGKVFLTMPGVNAFGNTCPPNSQIVDFVGYGATASCYEGSGPTGTTGNSTAALRKAGGCTDADNNASDFDVSAPSPRNSRSPQNFCGTAPSAVIQFSQATLSTTENSGSIGLLVTRTVNTSGVSTVDYATSDSSGANNCSVVNGNASSRCDYITSIGTLQFAAGETFKLINIPLIDDSYAEGTENFLVTLSNPTAATLGTPATTTVVLNDNETTTGVNPIDQSGFFVRENYIDFLNREPDNAGNNFWIGEINNCTPKPQCTEIKRINVSAAFFLSIEFHETGYLVERLYKAAYGDATGTSTNGGVSHQLPMPIIRLSEFVPDGQQLGRGVIVGQTGWEQILETNKQTFIAQFVTRSRFSSAYPSTLTPAQFVDALFSHVGVTPSASERSSIIDEFPVGGTSANNAARARALRRVAENANFDQLENPRAFVLMQYFGYLRRNPNDLPDSDYSGYDFWLTKLNQFNGNFVNAEMVQSFIVSLEYRQRFGP
ncbi:MAG TPA: hypothetical protein DC047_10395 [Blastocatellia bacterium]|nr:hypothetical protein [Blastocatellia bacterium]